MPFDTRQWPRTQHARLVSGLNRAGAQTIVYDLHFISPRPAQDAEFAAAMRNAGNVLLPSFLDPCVPSEENCQTNNLDSHRSSPKVTLYQHLPPTPALAGAAAAIGPFTLSDSNRRVSQFWTFNPHAGDAPSLSLLALVHYVSSQGVSRERLRSLVSSIEKSLPPDSGRLDRRDDNQTLARAMIDLLRSAPETFYKALAESIAEGTSSSEEPDSNHRLTSLLSALSPPSSRYFNFIGPSASIRTIRFGDALKILAADGGNSPEARRIFAGKAVFIGLSSAVQRDQRDNYDYFDTVYSNLETGSKLSGIEILATAFSNLLHRETLRPVQGAALASGIILWGLIAAFLARLLTPFRALAVLSILCAGYLALAVHLFDAGNLWLPLLAPLALQATFSLFSATLLHYRQATREYRIIHNAFNQYLPEIAINRLVHEGFHTVYNRETLFGVCMFTDAEGYTSVAEKVPSGKLAIILESYKAVIEEIVNAHGGIVSDSPGDSVLAFWASRSDDLANRQAALDAMLKIDRAIGHWNLTNAFKVQLPTKIGLHCGELTLTRIEKDTASESRLVGDIVNTASRLEELNKHLGSRRLASAETIDGLESVVSQYVGRFVFKGKTIPIDVHQILGSGDDDRQAWTPYKHYFSAAVDAFQAQKWQAATELFGSTDTIRPGDPATQWYFRQIEQFQQPSQPVFDGTFILTTKRPGE